MQDDSKSTTLAPSASFGAPLTPTERNGAESRLLAAVELLALRLPDFALALLSEAVEGLEALSDAEFADGLEAIRHAMASEQPATLLAAVAEGFAPMPFHLVNAAAAAAPPPRVAPAAPPPPPPASGEPQALPAGFPGAHGHRA